MVESGHRGDLRVVAEFAEGVDGDFALIADGERGSGKSFVGDGFLRVS